MEVELLAGSEEGFVDLSFGVEILQSTTDELDIRLRAVHDGLVVGLRASLALGMAPGLVGGEIDTSAFYHSGVVFLPDGDSRTEDLIRIVAAVSGIEYGVEILKPSIAMTAFPLQTGPVYPLEAPCKFKLFHDDRCENREYAEVYLNLDVPNRRASLDEKDPAYRAHWIRAWCRRPGEWSRCTLKMDPGPLLIQVSVEQLREALLGLCSADRGRMILTDDMFDQLILVGREEHVGALITTSDQGTGRAVYLSPGSDLSLADATSLALCFLEGRNIDQLSSWRQVEWAEVKSDFSGNQGEIA